VALKKLTENFSFVCILVFQCKIVQSINLVLKELQSKKSCLAKAAKLRKVCLDELHLYRNQFDDLREEASNVAKKWSFLPEF
jgi:hypothetical protein